MRSCLSLSTYKVREEQALVNKGRRTLISVLVFGASAGGGIKKQKKFHCHVGIGAA